MASLAKYIKELQEIERKNPGAQIFHGTQHGEAAFEHYRITQKQVSKRMRKGIRWISAKSKLTAFVIEPTRKPEKKTPPEPRWDLVVVGSVLHRKFIDDKDGSLI